MGRERAGFLVRPSAKRRPISLIHHKPLRHRKVTVKKSSVNVLGAILVVLGGIFTLQGLGYLGGSPMTGVTLWAIIGPILAVVGVALLVRTSRAGRTG